MKRYLLLLALFGCDERKPECYRIEGVAGQLGERTMLTPYPKQQPAANKGPEFLTANEALDFARRAGFVLCTGTMQDAGVPQ